MMVDPITPWEEVILATNRTQTGYDRNCSVQTAVGLAAKARPEAIAIVENERKWTYAELQETSNRIANALIAAGATKGSVVGLFFDRSAQMVASMLGVLKSGAAYLPIEPDYPADRIRFMIEDAAALLLLSNREHVDEAILAGRPLCSFNQALENGSPEDPEIQVGGGDMAYVMYTSGSTGAPKGVQVTHRGIVRLVSQSNYVDIQPSDVFAQLSHPCFDAITFEVWGPLINGARLEVLGKEIVLSPARLKQALRERGITTLWLTAPLFNIMAASQPDAFGTLKTLLIGGDALDPRSVRQVQQTAPPRHFVNGYGPTECTVFSVCEQIALVGPEQKSVPIGYPISNSTAFVLNDQMKIAGPGEMGELYLGGDGLGLGYLNRPDLTADRFISHPLAGEGGKFYKTGDLAFYLPDGKVEFGGRKDNQVKLSGFRIELDSIEAQARAHPAVREVVVMVAQLEGGHKQLQAHLSTHAGMALDEREFSHFLSERLPAHEVPHVVFVHAQLPLNSSGKFDRSALLEHAFARGKNVAAAMTGVSDAQATLLSIWENILGLRPPGLDSNFFEIGGTSIMLAQVEDQIERQFQVRLSVLDLFEYNSIRKLADRLAGVMEEKNRPEAADRAQHQRAALDRMKRFAGARRGGSGK